VLGADTIYKRMPQVLTASDRAHLTALRFAYEMAYAHLERLREGAIRHLCDGEPVGGPNAVTDLMASAWGIVDCLNRVRRLVYFGSNRDPGPTARAFLAATEAVKTLRDEMQHFERELPGEGSETFVMGQLGWWDWRPGGANAICVWISPGAATSNRALVGGSIAPEARPPVSHFELRVASCSLDLERAVRDSHDYLVRLGESWLMHVEQHAAKFGDRAAQLLEPTDLADITICLDVTFD